MHVLIHKQFTVTSLVVLRADTAKRYEQRSQEADVLEPLQIVPACIFDFIHQTPSLTIVFQAVVWRDSRRQPRSQLRAQDLISDQERCARGDLFHLCLQWPVADERIDVNDAMAAGGMAAGRGPGREIVPERKSGCRAADTICRF